MLSSLIFALLSTESFGENLRQNITQKAGNSPTVEIHNGTLEGTYNEFYQQDLFLGIPYAQPPVNELRFRTPRPLSKWDGVKKVDSYGPFCQGHQGILPGFDQKGVRYKESEDCLSINVVRPTGHYQSSALPVLVWIYGGGFIEGGSGDRRYNMSYLAKTSVEMDMPTIMVSFNYRVSGWGFLAGSEMAKYGLLNLGLKDQRMALRWVQENIHYFGGDPMRVTIHGESAGAASVGFHLLAHGGRDDGLFRAAIAQSGGPLSYSSFDSVSAGDARFHSVLNATGCHDASDTMRCLQTLPAAILQNSFAQYPWYPSLDGDLISDYTSVSLKKGEFVKVPLLIGSNTNEGTPFMQLLPNIAENFDGAVLSLSTGKLGSTVLEDLNRLYTIAADDSADYGLGTVVANPGSPYGPDYGKVTLFLGDYMFTSGRRTATRKWAEGKIPVYSYRFNTVPAGVSPQILGSAHFEEVAYVFRNTDGNGYETNPFNVSMTKRGQFECLSEIMSRMWLSFVNTGSPNHHGLFAPDNVHLEKDNYRVKAMDLIDSSAQEFSR
ncbi:hypothetical protein EYZ11_003633 [Aspergillus tanneri]|uniref:Carboxylic ester hydrolase n=1 Tax=Aspergillus tanneri TaxID=1220188 RepID=A0A4S3JMT3_9EURO|nr:hypothetical protein EYZ11_003633 [Aspergillus tanneri]